MPSALFACSRRRYHKLSTGDGEGWSNPQQERGDETHRVRWKPPSVVSQSSLHKAGHKACSLQESSQAQVCLKSRIYSKVVVHIYISQGAGVHETCHQSTRDARAQHFFAGGRSELNWTGLDWVIWRRFLMR